MARRPAWCVTPRLIASGGTLTYAGRSDAATFPPLAADVIDIDAHGAAVIPGFVDAHTHIAWLGDRSAEYAERAAGVSDEEIGRRGGGISATVRSTAAGTVEEIRRATEARARRMLEGGSTTIEVKSGYGLALDAEMRQLEAAIEVGHEEDLPDVVPTYLPLHAPADGDRTVLLDEVCTTGVRSAATRASSATLSARTAPTPLTNAAACCWRPSGRAWALRCTPSSSATAAARFSRHRCTRPARTTSSTPQTKTSAPSLRPE